MGHGDQAADPGFFSDLRSSFHVLMAQPALPLMSIVVWGLPGILPPALSVLVLPVWIFSIGYPGRNAFGSSEAFEANPSSAVQHPEH